MVAKVVTKCAVGIKIRQLVALFSHQKPFTEILVEQKIFIMLNLRECISTCLLVAIGSENITFSLWKSGTEYRKATCTRNYELNMQDIPNLHNF